MEPETLKRKENRLYSKLFSIVKKLWILAISCRVVIGCRPSSVEGPAIIFFPFLPATLHCGFAGIMTCRFPAPSKKINIDTAVDSLWKKVRNASLRNMTSEGNIHEQYLGGEKILFSIHQAALELKSEDAQELLFFRSRERTALDIIAKDMKNFLEIEDKFLEERASLLGSTDLEAVNRRILLLKDTSWMLDRDILANLHKIFALTGAKHIDAVSPAAFRKYRKLNLLLNALDRLEVRGRDSAGIQLTFGMNMEDMADVLLLLGQNGLEEQYTQRSQKGDLLNASLSVSSFPGGPKGSLCVTFTYKTFSIVGELGYNVSKLRSEICKDRILQCFANAGASFSTALTHTRWASVGAITEENSHPVNNYSIGHSSPVCAAYPGFEAEIHAVLNGDIDNYAELRHALEITDEKIAERITTDTKIIPLQIQKYLRKGKNMEEAFLLAGKDFEGSHAIAVQSNLEPGKLFLALKGSGQSIYVGISADQYMVASELYGIVEVMPGFLKMNGEEGGQIFILDANQSGGLSGIRARSYDGNVIELKDTHIQTAEISTRDIDRGPYSHYFLKEISESSLSVKRTLRGKYRISEEGEVFFNLGPDIVPMDVRAGLKGKTVRKIAVIGHGTAAVAGQAVADALSYHLENTHLQIAARVASELSGFGLKEDMSDTLVIPITQSGTTTDTNRAVAMARERGARIISIVNRRQSDITAKSHGVFYTSDGRDIEMSVASTKAFYSQIIAGNLLALFFSKLMGVQEDSVIAVQLKHLESAPQWMEQIFAGRDAIAASVKKAAGKKFWAIVGSGPNKAAADEIRIKLSELCYKTLSTDIIENKKHIDLSAEPLILACVSGNPPAVVEDILKDVAIFKAHKAAVIVFADRGDTRFDAVADAVISVPLAPSPLPVILHAVAGHLWGYFAALAIDEEAQIFRVFRGRLLTELLQRTQKKLSIFDMLADDSLHRMVSDFNLQFHQYLQSGAFCSLGGKTLADLLLLLKYAAGKLPLQEIRRDFENDKDFFSPYDLLDRTLGAAIDELARPIDAIRHQAKTVTVGTSRKEQELGGILFDLLKALHFSLKNLTYREIMTLKRIQPACREIRGYTVYSVKNLNEKGNPTDESSIEVLEKGGVASCMKSRADLPTALMGVKRTIVSTGHVYVGRGKTDSVPIIIIPLRETETGIHSLLLIHMKFNEHLPLAEKIAVLGYRYSDIRNLLDEYNLPWSDQYMEDLSLEDLFSESVEAIAQQIKFRFFNGK